MRSQPRSASAIFRRPRLRRRLRRHRRRHRYREGEEGELRGSIEGGSGGIEVRMWKSREEEIGRGIGAVESMARIYPEKVL
jgi:hypothetical protein